jgi:parallel beta-helix repeat protein
MKKLVAIIVAGILLGTIIGIYVTIEQVKAVRPEVPLDRAFIEDLAYKLAHITDSKQFWMGRAYGSPGEREAKRILSDEWNNNTDYDLEAESITLNSEQYGGFVNDKFDVTEQNYSLYIGNETEPINRSDYQPVPCLIPWFQHIQGNYTIRIPPENWYKNFPSSEELLEKTLKENNMLYEFKYTLLNDAPGITGEVVYIEDYESASIEDTQGRIHLVEIEQNACDEVFNETINNVIEYKGTGYIIITTNPTFIDTKNTAIPGFAISQYDGEQLKEIIQNNYETLLEIEDDPIPQEGTLKIYCHYDDPNPSKDIYLVDGELCRKYGWAFHQPFKVLNHIFWHSILNCSAPDADAFIFSDMNQSDGAHVMFSGGGLSKNDWRSEQLNNSKNVPLKKYCWRPAISINHTLEHHILDCHKNQSVEIKIYGDVVNDSVSYNLIGTIPGKDHSKQIFIGGHYDSKWGQCPIDNGFSSAIAWGIAKYFHDNNITPEYDLKIVAWAGEEMQFRGSNFYVCEHYGERDKFYGIINIDVVGINTTLCAEGDIPLKPWIYPGRFTQSYWDILNVMDLEKYSNITKYPHVDPDKPLDGKWIHRRDKICYGMTDSSAFCNLTLPNINKPLVDFMISIERSADDYDFKVPYPVPDDALYYQDLLAFYDHRTGNNFTKGDTWSKVDMKEVFCIANMVLNLTKHLAVDCSTTFSDGCSYTPQDLDGDTKYDSVKISFSASTDISSWCTLESKIYKNGQPCSATFTTDLVDLSQGENTTSNLTVTLPANASAGYYNIRVYLKDTMGNQDDFDNTTLYLYPYNNSIANFEWERNENNLKMINFTDLSLPSPNATLVSWNWSFGDGNYSEQQNCTHNYSHIGTFNVTLTIIDSANKTTNITKQVKTFNTEPTASFTVDPQIVITDTEVEMNSDSSDVDGSIVNTTWYFSDNTTGYGENVQHTYEKSGFYTISLEVTDDDNESTYTTKTNYVLVADALVDDDFENNPEEHKFTTITEALKYVEKGDILYVFNGSYDPIEIAMSVSIYGESRENVLISGGNPVVQISANDIVTIQGVTIQNGTCGINITNCDKGLIHIEDCNISGNDDIGILLDHSYNCSVISCTVSGSDIGVKIINGSGYNLLQQCDFSEGYYGVYISESSHNWVGSSSISNPYPTDCLFTYNAYAIYLDEADNNLILGCDIDGTPHDDSETIGIYLEDSMGNTISTCKIHNATEQGIYLDGATGNKIEHSKITENGVYGIDISGSDSFNNLIVQNSITDNMNYGIHIPLVPMNNSIYYNDVIDNGNPSYSQAYDSNNRKGTENLWSKEGNNTLTKQGLGEGNYWDDYTGEDNNSDGIGDTPYEIDGPGNDDSYPLMEKYNWCTGTGWE